MSIYQRMLGNEFFDLHPQVQRRFGVSLASGFAVRCTGVLRQVWRGGAYLAPIMRLGAWRRVSFPAVGEDLPFTMTAYAFRDAFHRESVVLQRTFHYAVPFHTVAYSVFSERRRRVIDYLGTHAHLTANMHGSIDANGGMHLRSGALRLQEGRFKVKLPRPIAVLSNAHEWYDQRNECFSIDLRIINPLLGDLFGFSGYYRIEELAGATMPEELRPIRSIDLG